MMPYAAILIVSLFSTFPEEKGFRFYENGVPTAAGVSKYVYLHEHEFAKEYMEFVNDSLQEYSIRVDDLSLYMLHDSLEFGRYYYPAEIVITNEGRFIDYAVDSLARWQRNNMVSNRFVKGCVFHELTHIWIQQIMREMRYLGMAISPEYSNFRLYHEINRGYGAEFMEEGICEYIAHKAGEILYPEKVSPDFSFGWDSFEINYLYAEYYVRQILEPYADMKEGIMKILQTPPPTQEEIQNPELFFERMPD